MLEIKIIKTSSKHVNLEEDTVDEAINSFMDEVENTSWGKALLEDGYNANDYDLDDEELTLVYTKTQ